MVAIKSNKDETIVLTPQCRMCQGFVAIEVKVADWEKFKTGQFNVQAVFPYLSPADREMFISQTCGKCWDEMFAGMEDE